MIPNLTPATRLPTATLEMQPQPMCCFPVVSPDNDSWSRGECALEGYIGDVCL